MKRFLEVKTATENERIVQLAFGLSSMAGPRLGDMQHLRWCDIKDIDGVPTICITQRKTKRPVPCPNARRQNSSTMKTILYFYETD